MYLIVILPGLVNGQCLARVAREQFNGADSRPY